MKDNEEQPQPRRVLSSMPTLALLLGGGLLRGDDLMQHYKIGIAFMLPAFANRFLLCYDWRN